MEIFFEIDTGERKVVYFSISRRIVSEGRKMRRRLRQNEIKGEKTLSIYLYIYNKYI